MSAPAIEFLNPTVRPTATRTRLWLSLARAVILESLRRKDLYVVGILGFLLMVSAGTLGFFGLQGLETFAKDLATTVLGLFSTIVAVLTGSRLMPDEIRNRTLYPLLARPMSRFDLIMGKFLGAVAVTWIAFGILAVLTGLALALFGVRFEAVMGQYLLLKSLGLAVVCAVSLCLSMVMTPSAAATMGFVLAFGTTMIVRALTMAYETASPAMQWLFKLVNAALPQYGLFDMGSRAANSGWGPVPLWVVGALLGYAVCYSSAMLALAWLKFRRQVV
ncbi:MAG TPA: ABC transporter permease [Fimbriimonadaceae bacterium]|nr:ABC transporter permease [Fimbriimonadaceae bacterium]HRJ32330.1 ABC transporter permease [Fimbriimonadaceae bacterium]